MTGPVDPCPHVLPCGACIDCCERDHNHDKETGVAGVVLWLVREVMREGFKLRIRTVAA